MCQLLAPDVYEWLKVFTRSNELFIEKNISINDSHEMKENIKDHNKDAYDAVIGMLYHNDHVMEIKSQEIDTATINF